jgi:hypothetical protein
MPSMRLPLPFNALRRVLFAPVLALATLLAGEARADEAPSATSTPSATPAATPAPAPHAFALVVGDNEGGPGQAPLHFAETDAKAVAEVLRSIGHYGAGDVQVLLHPDAAAVTAALDELVGKVRARADRGETSKVVFYYSGHARANAINLGGEELALGTLRDRLSALPSALTLVVLDACQSGSFSRVKGAEPAADFSYNSVTGLKQKGLAVMASSTSAELSQESDELKASYFTHHLVTALRGAGDADRDGRVSLDEAYRYAYRQTLASTALTQVGEQHVTLETDLAGEGEVPLTFPAEARAQLGIPGPIDARILVQEHGNGAVAAELTKVPGPPLQLALVAGVYDAIVRQSSGIVECRVTLVDDQVTVLDLSSCTPVVPHETAAKGEAPFIREQDRWAVELGLGFISRTSDGFTQRAEAFGYQQSNGFLSLPPVRVTIGVSRSLAPHLAGVLQLGTLSSDSYTRSIGSSTDTVSLHGYGGAIYLRASTDIVDHVLGIYGQAGAGLTIGFLGDQTQQTGVPPSSSNSYFGYLLSAAGGFTIRLPALVTLFAQFGYDLAPAITDLVGDTHDSGGFEGVVGARFRFGDRL